MNLFSLELLAIPANAPFGTDSIDKKGCVLHSLGLFSFKTQIIIPFEIIQMLQFCLPTRCFGNWDVCVPLVVKSVHMYIVQ